MKARGHRPCLYASDSMLKVLRTPAIVAAPETLIWAARYGGEPSKPYDVWQHSSTGKVPGITASAGVVPWRYG